MKIKLLICLSFLHLLVSAQDAPLSYSDYINLVLDNHPMVKLANLEVEQAKANLMKARGNFDPYIDYNYSEKQYEGTEYYQIQEGKLKIPTGLGPNLGVGYEKAEGVYLNPQHTVPQEGLLNFGIEASLLQGLWVDESRTILRQAKAIKDAAELEKEFVRNQLILFATNQYWDWFEAWNKLKVQEKGVVLAKERFKGIVDGAVLGDLPFVDTLEANIQYQNRLVSYESAFASYQVSQINLSFFLWEDTLNINQDKTPPIYVDLNQMDYSKLLIPDTLNFLIQNHPELNQKLLKIKLLDYERKLANQYFLPKVDVKFNPLYEANEFYNNPDFDYQNNYKFGLNIKIPVFYRKERGNLKSIKAYQEQSELEMTQKRKEIYNKANASFRELIALRNQITSQERIVKDSWELLKAEEQNFRLGESSIFMINSRENSYIKAENKYIELITKQRQTFLKYKYYSNDLK